MKNILLSLILLSTMLVSFGCAATPSQKFKTASDLYQTTGTAVAAAINADLVDVDTAIAIGRIDEQAHTALITWRENYPFMTDDEAHSEIERVLAIIRGIRAVVAQQIEPSSAELAPN